MALTSSPFLYASIPMRFAGIAGDLPRQYLLDYIVCAYIESIVVVPAGPATYAITYNPCRGRALDFTVATLDKIPGVQVHSCLHHVATLTIPSAPSIKVIKEEIACAFASYDANGYDITSALHKYEEEMAYEIQADYHLDEAA